MAETDWLACSYAVVIVSLAIVAFVAVIYPTQIAPRLLSNDANMLQDLEGYLTARNSQNKWRIAFSFFAGSVGSWAVTTPASYACFAGWVGMVFYALATGLPIMVIAYFGNLVREKYPTAQALGDMVVLRFGPTLRLCTCIVALFNMAIFMLAEFTTIGSLFKDFVGSVNYPIMIVMAVLTTTYSTYGGLVTSIVTDQIQAVACLTFILVLSIYIWATFKQPLVPGFGDLAPLLGPNDSGYGAIFVMPVSLMAATVFNEGVWQRVWAAQDTQALKQGGIIGGIFLIIALFLLGLFGWLAAWGGLVDFVNTNPNLYLFQVFKRSPEDPANSSVDSGIEVLVLVLALVMSESAIDSLQLGIASTISATFLKGYSMWVSRAVVVVINIIIVPFALANYNVLSLFLSSNMLGCCWFLPLMLGTIWDSPVGRKVLSETTVVLGCVTAIILNCVYGCVAGPSQCARLANAGVIFEPYHAVCQCATVAQMGSLTLDDSSKTDCVRAGIHWTWIGNPYMWEYFVFVTFVSLAATLLYGVINLGLPDSAPSISDVLVFPKWLARPDVPAAAAAAPGAQQQWQDELKGKQGAGVPQIQMMPLVGGAVLPAHPVPYMQAGVQPMYVIAPHSSAGFPFQTSPYPSATHPLTPAFNPSVYGGPAAPAQFGASVIGFA